MSQFFTSHGQSTGAPASASVLPVNVQDWSPSGRTGRNLLPKRVLASLYNVTQTTRTQTSLRKGVLGLVLLMVPLSLLPEIFKLWDFNV